MLNREERLLSRVGELAAASAMDVGRWHDCVAAIAKLTNSAGVALFCPSAAPADCNLGVYGAFAASSSRYFSYWIRHDPWNLALAGTGRYQHAGEILFGAELVPDDQLKRTRYFQEHARFDDSGHKLFIKVVGASDAGLAPIHLTLGRSFRQDQFDAEAASMMRRVLPDLRTALEASASLQASAPHGTAGSRLQFSTADPCLLLRPDRRIEFVNAAAEHLLTNTNWIRTAGGCLDGVGDAGAAVIDQLIRQAQQGSSSRALVGLEWTPGTGLRRGTLLALPTRDTTQMLPWHRAAVLLLLLVESRQVDAVWISENLARRYRLSLAEGRVLGLLVEGRDVEQIARGLSISAHTVRTHLRSLREKTGRNSLAQLVRLGLGR